MLKIIKYEFIKSRASLLALIITAAALYALSLLGDALHVEWLKYVSLGLLLLFAFVAYIYTLARGISAYSAELKNKTGYLLMMTPRSTYAILFGKLIFSLVLAALMLAVSYYAIISVAAEIFGSRLALRGYYNITKALVAQIGINPGQVLMFIAAALGNTLLNILALVSLGYFAVTATATLFRNKRGHGFVTFLLFAVLLVALTTAEYYLADYVMRGAEISVEFVISDILRRAIPVLAFNVAAICAFTCASAALLKKRVCL